MNSTKKITIYIGAVITATLCWLFQAETACAGQNDSAAPPLSRVQVVEPVIIEFEGPLNDRHAEVSSLTWKDDWLVILPQDPGLFAEEDMLGFFTIHRKRLMSVISGRSTLALVPEKVDLAAAGMMRLIEGFDGLEAMGIMGDHIFMTIEAKEDTLMAGYLVCGKYGVEGQEASIDMTRLTSIPLGCNIPNIAEEALVIHDQRVITISEANGLNVSPQPKAKAFDFQTNYLGSIAFPQIEYRVTDATAVDTEDRFWVINYFFPPERDKLKPAPDPELEKFGYPEGYDSEGCVERLLELRFTEDDRIVRTDTPPINLKLIPGQGCRNWEALVRLDDLGFLLMTDKYPGTLLAFVPNPYTSPSEKN